MTVTDNDTPATTGSDAAELFDFKNPSKRPLQLEVRYVYIPFISKISTLDLTFDLRVDFDILWAASNEDIELYSTEPATYRPISYVPSLVMQNAREVDILEVEGPYGSPYRLENNKNFVRLKVTGTFLQDFDLSTFPFDSQRLKITTTLSFKNADEVVFAPEDPTKDIMYVLTNYNAIADWEIIDCKLESTIDSSNFAFLHSSILIRRIPWSIIVKQFLVCILITSLALVAYSLTSRSDRLNFLITQLLTVVALQFTLSELLPPTPLPTFADIFMITCSIYILCIMFQAATSEVDTDGQYVSNDSSSYAVGAFCILMGLFSIASAILFIFSVSICKYYDTSKRTYKTHTSKGKWNSK